MHDASENLGAHLEAYYDEATKRWVFPGEETTVDPALAPPPTENFLAAAAAAAAAAKTKAGPPNADAPVTGAQTL